VAGWGSVVGDIQRSLAPYRETGELNVSQPSVASAVRIIDLAFVERARHALETAFGVRFEMWYWDEEWSRVTAAALDDPYPLSESLQAHFTHLLDDAHEQSRPRCQVIDARETLLAIPVPGPRKTHLVATAAFEDVPPSYLVRFAQMFCRGFDEHKQIESLRQENDAFLRQVTNDFEELTFLRSMSELLEVSDLTFDFDAMARQVLPTLLPLVESDALVLVAAKRDGDPRDQLPAEVDGVSIWEGARSIDEATCLALTRRFVQDATHQPVVKNHFQEMPEGRDYPGVEHFVMVPVSHGRETIAWLLALNRNHEGNLNVGEMPWEVSYLEYGTHEATLMASSAAILATHSRNVELFREREHLLVSVVRALVSAIDAKDEYTRGHSERVALIGKHLAAACGLSPDQCERIYLAGLLHDVGKIGVRDVVLRKPGKLDPDEYDEIKTHPEKGWGILADLEPLGYVLPGVLFHHERFDGTGYPDQLAGEQIPLDGRILAVADAYDAMTSDRPYRPGMPQAKAESVLRAGAGAQWDATVIDTFFRIMPEILEIRDAYQLRRAARRQAGSVKRES
jgi:HD-GYP domain-containing protein (c-di-GMP phosphodiesterase class II)